MGNSGTKWFRLTDLLSSDENVEELREFLTKKGVSVNARLGDRRTAIMVAARKSSPQCLKVLLDAGADVNITDKNGKTALCFAAFHGSQDCVNALLAAGADVNKKDRYGRTALYHALCGRHKASVDVLMDARADVTIACPRLSFLLNPALRIGHHRIVALLIDAGVDVNDWLETFDKEDGTNNPLICVAKEGIWSAEQNKYITKCVQLLLKAGIRVNKKFMGHNALTWYCYQNRHPDEIFVRLLYAAGEVVEWPELENWAQGCVFIPEWLQGVEAVRNREECWNLMDLCRVLIRSLLLQLDCHSNLFIRVSRLGLPAPITRYLLYDMTLWCTSTRVLITQHLLCDMTL